MSQQPIVFMRERRKPPLSLRATPAAERLMHHFEQLEAIHRDFGTAANALEAWNLAPICTGCGKCCETNTVLCQGVEAEYIASWLLGQPGKINPVLDRCEAWLIEPGAWTYGPAKITMDLMNRLAPEFNRAARGQCPLLAEDKSCTVHYARPVACRAYAVTRVPGPECPKPLGIHETPQDRVYWDASDPSTPIQQRVQTLQQTIQDPKYRREGFLYTMLMLRFRPERLAELWDTGKIPVVKMYVGYGGSKSVLWQEDLDAEWERQGLKGASWEKQADLSIQQAIHLSTDATPHQILNTKTELTDADL